MTPKINLVYFFFKDDYQKWSHKDMIDSFVDTNKGSQVVGVTYPITVGTLLTNPVRFFRFVLRRAYKLREGLYMFVPISILPLSVLNRFAWSSWLDRVILKRQINTFLDSINTKDNIVTWVYRLAAVPVFSDIITNSKLLVYDVRDDYILDEDKVIADAQRLENLIIAKADLVFTVSKNLFEAKKFFNSNCYEISNGVNFKLLSKSLDNSVPKHESLIHLKRPVIGYIGNIRSWLDFDLLGFLADNMNEASFVFVGPIEKNVKADVENLKKKKNVFFIPKQDRESLPSILKCFDVGLVPFKMNRFNLATNPFKFMEYFAAGKPVLSLRIPGLEIYDELAGFYSTKDEALIRLHQLLGNNGAELTKKRINLARKNDVANKAQECFDVLTKVLSRVK